MTLPNRETKRIMITIGKEELQKLNILRKIEKYPRTKSKHIEYLINKEYNKKRKTTLIRKKIDNLIRRT